VSDLYLTTTVLVIISIAMIVVGYRAAHRLKTRPGIRTALLLFVFAAMLSFLLLLRDDLGFVHVFPGTGVPVLGEALSIPFAALLIGLLFPYLYGGRLRRIFLSLVLGLAASVPLLRLFFGAPPLTRVTGWRNGVCLQTSPSSCSAASAATLLHAFGIDATEPEMAEICLTREDGTSMLGVYRGLCRKTERTDLRVNVIAHGSIAELRRIVAQTPILLSVGLDRWPSPDIDPRYQRDWGWVPGMHHAVVLFGILPDGRLDVGDPSVGREKWRATSLDVLWHGQALYLAKQPR